MIDLSMKISGTLLGIGTLVLIIGIGLPVNNKPIGLILGTGFSLLALSGIIATLIGIASLWM